MADSYATEFRNRLAERCGTDDLVFLADPDTDAAVLGISTFYEVTYDAQKLVDILVTRDGMPRESAHAHAEEHIFNAYDGPFAPQFIWIDPEVHPF